MPADEVQAAAIRNTVRPIVRTLLKLQVGSRSLPPLLPIMMPPDEANDADVWMPAEGEFPTITVEHVRLALSARNKIAAVTDPQPGDPPLAALTVEESLALVRFWPSIDVAS